MTLRFMKRKAIHLVIFTVTWFWLLQETLLGFHLLLNKALPLPYNSETKIEPL